MADFLLLVVTILAAAGWIFSKEALVGFPPLLFIAIRFLLAAAIITCCCLPALRRLSQQQLKDALKVGFSFAAAITCWIHGLFHSNHLGEGAFLTSLAVVLVPVFARFWFNEKPPLSTWIALPISFLGLGFLSLNNGFHFDPGQLFFLVAALLFALHFNLNTLVVARVGALPLTAIQLTVVGIVALMLSPLLETWPKTVHSSIWMWLFASAVIATAMRFFIQTHAQGLAPASHAAVILTVEPVWTATLAAFWFDESMTALQLIGCSCIFAALIISRWRWVAAMFRRPHRIKTSG